jgi:signal transduction histidine kinase
MATTAELSPRCLLLAPLGPEFEALRRVAKGAAERSGVRLASAQDATHPAAAEAVFSEILAADLVLALLSHESPGVLYHVGIAHALGKPVVFLLDDQAGSSRFFTGPLFLAPSSRTLGYNSHTAAGLNQLESALLRLLEDFKREPQRFRVFPQLPAGGAFVPIVDLDRLEPREFENLCFELLTQMGYKRVEWGEGMKEIDLVATLPRKDPDGFEYRELWLISMGLHAPPEMLLEMATTEPDHFVRRLLRRDVMEMSRAFLRQEAPVTLLLIPFRSDPPPDVLQDRLRRLEERYAERGSPFTLRVRLWDKQHLATLIRQYPQISYKYSAGNAPARSTHRKTLEELYQENVELTQQLQAATVALKRAERDAVWKEVAFKAAHKLGNPIFALETDLQSIKRRLQTHPDQAFAVALEMGSSIEKAKTIIEQFKSLTRAQKISVRPVDLVPLIKGASHVAEEKGVRVGISAPEKPLHARADPVRMTECFDELFANALHWLDKPEKRIDVAIDAPKRELLPPTLHGAKEYVRVVFRDNGSGVPLDKKDDIFAPFYTTYAHGTGLGLSLVQRVIEGHGGLIRETGKPGDGATFELYIPQAAPASKVS